MIQRHDSPTYDKSPEETLHKSTSRMTGQRRDQLMEGMLGPESDRIQENVHEARNPSPCLSRNSVTG